MALFGPELPNSNDMIEALYEMVGEFPEGDSDQPQILGCLGGNLHARFEQSGDLRDLESSISALQLAVDLTSDDYLAPEGHISKWTLLNTLSAAFHSRFKRLEDLHDLESALSVLCRAVELLSDDDPMKILNLTNIGLFSQRRFEHLGQLEDLEKAVSAQLLAVELAPESFLEQGLLWGILGHSLKQRYNRLGSLDDLEGAISMQRLAMEFTPVGDPDRRQTLSSLGSSLAARFERIGHIDDLEEAISIQRTAMELTPACHDDELRALNNLGVTLETRFGHLGNLDDIEEAILLQRLAVEGTSSFDSSMPERLSNLCQSLCIRYARLGALDDLESGISMQRLAINLARKGDPILPTILNSFASLLQYRYQHLGGIKDIEDAITSQRRAVDLTPDNHPFKSVFIGNSACLLMLRYERGGDLRDLDGAISEQRIAVEMTLSDSPLKLRTIANLGNYLSRRFERLSIVEDVDSAIDAQRFVVDSDMVGYDHPERPSFLHNLGASLDLRFVHMGQPHDLEEAVSFKRLAVGCLPSGHYDRPHYLCGLGTALFRRFISLGQEKDIDEAVSVQSQAVDETSDDASIKSLRLQTLSKIYFKRFERRGELQDLDSSISVGQRAVELTPNGNPAKSECCHNLGHALQSRFERNQSRADFELAIYYLESAITGRHGNPLTRLSSAMCCLSFLQDNPQLTSTENILLACSRALNTLPEAVWLGHNVQRRYKEMAKLGDLVSTAVASAIVAGALSQAVEWLEAGRSLVWAQILSLRTPLDELKDQYPQLAEDLRVVREQLRNSGLTSQAPEPLALDSANGAGFPTILTNAAEDRHRGLVIEYERILAEARAQAGFEDFLLPKKLPAIILSHDLMDGPIVFINVHSFRCDAIILCTDSGTEITSVGLPELSQDRANKLGGLWATNLKARMDRTARSTALLVDMENELNLILRYMWEWIVRPILEALDLASLITNDKLPHITWCPTGPLTQLPLHAAGIYDDPFGPRIFDFVVSSYTPSIAILRNTQRPVSTPEDLNVLIVTQPATPNHTTLPGTRHEGARLQKLFTASKILNTVLDDEHATVDAVRSSIEQHPWVHLACHGWQNKGDATQSAFALYDGPLSLATLMGTAVENAELAFLSACQTAVGDQTIPEESAHLAAGMLAVGYKGTVATMWSIVDADAPIVVEAFYEKLLELRSKQSVGRTTGAAYALHEATRILREEVGETSFMRWVPFVHFGI